MANKTARITRSTSRFLKEMNMINEVGNLIKVNETEIGKDLGNFDNQLIEKKINHAINKGKEKKVSFDSKNNVKESDKFEENQVVEQNDKNENIKQDQQLDKEEESKSSNKNSPSKKSSLEDGSSKTSITKESSTRKTNSSNHSPLKKNSLTIQNKKSIKEDEDKNTSNDEQVESAKTTDQHNVSIQKMECSPVKNDEIVENKIVDSNLVTPKSKTIAPKNDDEEWFTDDESSIKLQSIKSSKVNSNVKANPKNTNSKNVIKSGLPELRTGLKRSATVKSATKPTIDIKRNKTNEFTTPQSIKKLSRPLNFGSASKRLIRLPNATVTKSAFVNNKANIHLPKITNQQTTNHSELTSHTNHQRYLIPPTLSSSSISTSSQTSLKNSCPGTVQPAIKTLTRNNSNNSEGKQQRCFGESALKQKLEEEKRRKLLELKIAKEEDAKLKKDKFLQQRVLETKSKREERERKVREGKLLNDADAEQRRIAELKKQEELKKQLIQKQIEEAKKQAELKKIEEIKKLEEQKRLEMIKQQEEMKRQAEMKRQEELRQSRLEELKKKQVKKVEFDADVNPSNEELQTKLYEKLEKKLIEDKLKQKDTPIKQLIIEAVGKKNAEKSLYQPEVDPSLDVINLSLSTDDSSDEDHSELKDTTSNCTYTKDTTSNCTFIKDINNKAISSTFIKSSEKESTVETVDTQTVTNVQPISNVNKNVIESYDISDLCSEDEDEDEQRVMNKRIPMWAKGREFLEALKAQFGLRGKLRENVIKTLFSSIDSNVKLEEVFDQKKAEKFKVKIRPRGSSACWSSPPQTHIDKSFSTFY